MDRYKAIKSKGSIGPYKNFKPGDILYKIDNKIYRESDDELVCDVNSPAHRSYMECIREEDEDLFY